MATHCSVLAWRISWTRCPQATSLVHPQELGEAEPLPSCSPAPPSGSLGLGWGPRTGISAGSQVVVMLAGTPLITILTTEHLCLLPSPTPCIWGCGPFPFFWSFPLQLLPVCVCFLALSPEEAVFPRFHTQAPIQASHLLLCLLLSSPTVPAATGLSCPFYI